MPTASSTVLDRNLSALRSTQPRFALPSNAGRVRLIDGVWRVHDGQSPGVAIHSRDPQREADRAAQELLAKGAPEVVVAIGLGLGYLADALERLGFSGRLLAIEPLPDTVAPMLGRREWHGWVEGDRLRILVGPDYAGAGDCWNWFGDGTAEPALYVSPAIRRVSLAETEDAIRVVKRIRFDALGNAEARRDQAPRYLINTLRNLPALASQPDVSVLNGAAHGLPVIVAAAGPSLEGAIPALRQVREQALIIAVDTALRPLLANGVHPHAVVAVDSSEANGRHLIDLPPCEDTFLVSEGSLDPFAVAAFAGRTFFLSVSDHQPWPWLRSLGVSQGRLRAWGSVLTTAFDLALTMGADPVVFVGADLSYPGGRPYCRGVSFEEDWRRRERWGTPLVQQWQEAIDRWPRTVETDVTGQPVRTAAHLVAFRDWLVEQMRQDPSRRFINAGGAGILSGAGIHQMSAAEMANLFKEGASRAAPHLFRERYRSKDGERVRRATIQLAERASAGDASIPEFQDWQRFAPGLTIEGIAQALGAAASAFAPPTRQSAPSAATSSDPVEIDRVSLQQIVKAVPLVPFVIAPERLEVAYTGARMFRFRTTAAAIMCSAMRPVRDGVSEDGVPLTRVFDVDGVVPGTYAAWTDVVHFRASDGSDPRSNGRRYTILVPPPVVHLENLTLDEILARDL